MKSPKNKKLVFCAMSGGVDSSVAAALLKKQGLEVVGVHMKCWSASGDCGEQDAEDARRVADKLKIPFYVWDFEKEYKARVVDYMLNGYRNGITPNPDAMCNREIKFGIFLAKALAMGADYIATGHYVRCVQQKFKIQNSKKITKHKQKYSQTEHYILHTARDLNKDQSYFLWTLNQEQLKHCLFPIGEYTKPEVRALAEKFGLPTAQKKDSQGICFIGQISLVDFLKERLGVKPGVIMTLDNKPIGMHEGAHLYTIGQRHGLSIGGGGITYYVADKNIEKNIVYVASEPEEKKLFKKEFLLSEISWINNLKPHFPLRAKVRVRYRQPLSNCRISKKSTEQIIVKLDKLVRAVTVGQSAVFYDLRGKEMLGGGVIL